MKRYKIDFNNGKVSEATSTDGIFFEFVEGLKKGVCLNKIILEEVGATITEIEEPEREFFVTKTSFDRAYNACDLGDYRDVSICFYPKKVDMSELVKAVVLNEGEVIVDIEKLEKAYSKVRLGAWRGDTDASIFTAFCKELGLE
jgi:hypothetical protein